MYTAINPQEILQGDLIVDYEFIAPPTDELLVVERNQSGVLITKPVSQVVKPYIGGKIAVVANSFVSDAMVISQSCDIQRRDYVHLCPVHKLGNLITELSSKGFEQKRIDGVLDGLRKNTINYYFYLPPGSINEIPIEESYVDLQFVGMAPLLTLGTYSRTLSLTDLGRHRLTFKLTNLYSRPI